MEFLHAIRAALFEQYQEVVEQGLNYTRTRYDRVQDAAGKYQFTNPRTVEVRGETHCDIKGPEFCLMRKDEQFPLEKNKLYVRIEDGTLHYQVIALSGDKVNDTIELADIQCPLVQLDNPDQLKPYIHKILKITAERDHTHPQALISAFETYVFGLDSLWNDALLVEQWCGGVGMAERFDITAVIAQEICHHGNLVDVNPGQFKEPHFPRTLRFYNYLSTHDDKSEPWFGQGDQSRLGLDFGIVKTLHLEADSRRGVEEPWWARKNLAMLSALYAVRTIDIAELKDTLDPGNQPDLAESSRPRTK